MRVIILCGGMGTRMKEETEFRPKPLVEIGGMPILWHIMKIYSHYGFNDFILTLGYKGNMIKDYFFNYEWMSNDFTLNLRSRDRHFHYKHKLEDWTITFVDTGLETNTGGRVKKIEEYIQEEEFMLTYGDGVADIDIHELLDFHKSKNMIATLTGVHPMSSYGVLEIEDGGTVRGFKEKPRLDGWINAGFFVFNRRIFDYLDDNIVLEKEPMHQLAAERQLAIFLHHGFWKSMDTHKDQQLLNKIWSENSIAPWKIWED
ncbi:MAG: glucose-1-phosphate cytidylyltransferase [Candidatus Hodarchaeota archaeon]